VKEWNEWKEFFYFTVLTPRTFRVVSFILFVLATLVLGATTFLLAGAFVPADSAWVQLPGNPILGVAVGAAIITLTSGSLFIWLSYLKSFHTK